MLYNFCGQFSDNIYDTKIFYVDELSENYSSECNNMARRVRQQREELDTETHKGTPRKLLPQYPTSLITSKRASSNSAIPDLASLENKLVAFFQEPDTVEKIHSGRVKELAGNDTIYVRELYSQPKTIEVWAKLVIVAKAEYDSRKYNKLFDRRIKIIGYNYL